MELKIKASIDYDYEKAKFYLAELDVEKADEQPRRTTLKESVRKPGLQRKFKRSSD